MAQLWASGRQRLGGQAKGLGFHPRSHGRALEGLHWGNIMTSFRFYQDATLAWLCGERTGIQARTEAGLPGGRHELRGTPQAVGALWVSWQGYWEEDRKGASWPSRLSSTLGFHSGRDPLGCGPSPALALCSGGSLLAPSSLCPSPCSERDRESAPMLAQINPSKQKVEARE